MSCPCSLLAILMTDASVCVHGTLDNITPFAVDSFVKVLDIDHIVFDTVDDMLVCSFFSIGFSAVSERCPQCNYSRCFVLDVGRFGVVFFLKIVM